MAAGYDLALNLFSAAIGGASVTGWHHARHNPNAVVVIVAGPHGLGTFAATEVCVRDADQKRLYTEYKQYKGNFEALISYSRDVGGATDGRVTIAIEFVRGLKRTS